MRYFIPIILFLFSCKFDSDKVIDRGKFTFKMGSDTRIFFKNVRQSYYDLEENKVAKFDIFRLSERKNSEDVPLLNLAIIVNYLQDEAYLLLEPNAVVPDPPICIISRDPLGEEQVFLLETQNRESTLHFLSDIYEGLLNGNQFFLQQNNDEFPLLADFKSREAFRITIVDYFRLTRIY